MSHNLTLRAVGGEEFQLYQTPTHVTDVVLGYATTGERAARYVAWTTERIQGKMLQPDYVDHILHMGALINWLIKHPNHTWDRT